MGNCQAIDAAALVIRHPCGKIERLYWSISASEVMRLNPGHYVSLIIPLPASDQENNENQQQDQKTVRFTRIKLLRPNETLALGHAYRLVTNQEVMKVLRAKKYAKAKKQQLESIEKSDSAPENNQSSSCDPQGKSEKMTSQAKKPEGHQQRMSSTNASAMRSKSWRPSLHSISEAGS
ncbi:D-ribose-binding periplasmic protein [Parasponia andersonii]|uniref:D-ribose-binding periplasmic protein n=1 Tax=Parasponia andersonii TaxID=3476 RepID=A0A2P5BCR9_PARAD|nr:D-ribose-binding periplasmic protein [Parasponia andersonii]